MTPIKIVLADDHEFLREGIIAVLKDVTGINIAASAYNCSSLYDAIEKHEPRLVIMDLNIPGCDRLNLITTLRSKYPQLKILVLSHAAELGGANRVLQLGAEGYLVKSSTSSELKTAILAIIDGGKYFPELQKKRNNPHVEELKKRFQLTKREVDIVRMICNEMSTREIAASLFLSELTINTHRRNILRKLEVKNVAGLVNFARANELC